jgi:hypothetical protein
MFLLMQFNYNFRVALQYIEEELINMFKLLMFLICKL